MIFKEIVVRQYFNYLSRIKEIKKRKKMRSTSCWVLLDPKEIKTNYCVQYFIHLFKNACFLWKLMEYLSKSNTLWKNKLGSTMYFSFLFFRTDETIDRIDIYSSRLSCILGSLLINLFRSYDKDQPITFNMLSGKTPVYRQ